MQAKYIQWPIEQFWSQVDRRGESECWPWRGMVDRNGYGRFSVGGRKHRAHRVAFEVAVQRIPAGMVVMHRCDNPACCNPAHLTIGTQQDNLADCRAKGRSAVGVRHGMAQLSAEQVAGIKRRLADGAAQRQVAREFGTSRTTVYRIQRGQIWQSVQCAVVAIQEGIES